MVAAARAAAETGVVGLEVEAKEEVGSVAAAMAAARGAAATAAAPTAVPGGLLEAA